MNSKFQNNKHTIDILFVMTLFFVFALSMITLIILGANVYRGGVDHMNSNGQYRTSYAYITQKFRQYDGSDSEFTICSFGDSDALKIEDEINGTIYDTYLYLYDGSLCELFIRSDISLDPSDGTPILDLNDFNVSLENDSLYKFDISTASGRQIFYVSKLNGKQVMENE